MLVGRFDRSTSVVSAMPQYDIYADDGTHAATCEALVFSSPDDVRAAVLSSFPDMMRDIRPNYDQRVMQVVVRDRSGATVYTATLTLEGRWGESA